MAITTLTTATIQQQHPNPDSPYEGKTDPLLITYDPSDPRFVTIHAEWHQCHIRVEYADLAEALANIAAVMDA